MLVSIASLIKKLGFQDLGETDEMKLKRIIDSLKSYTDSMSKEDAQKFIKQIEKSLWPKGMPK